MSVEATYESARIDGRLRDRQNREVDVAIVGAGVSGLYSGWRLRTSRPAGSDASGGDGDGFPSVTILEMSDRVGGRLWSTTELPGLDGVVAELGGMRYMEHQRLFVSLAKLLGLPSEGFPMGNENRNLFYLRGTRFPARRWRDRTFRVPYQIPDELRGKHPDDLFGQVVDEVLKANGIGTRPKNRKEWDRIKATLKYDRGPDECRRLEEIGFWNLLQNHFGAEAYDLLSHAGGYYSNTINWNATEAMPYVVGDFSGDVEYKTLKGGLDQIARRLSLVFRNAGGELVGRARLVTFRPAPEGSRRRYELQVVDAQDGTAHTVRADRIILAMPRRSIELLSRDNLLVDDGRNQEFLRDLRSVIGEPSFKILLGFEPSGNGLPWWRHLGLESGRSITDLPIRQCYYFGTHPRTRHSLLLASYNDMRSVSFWKPLEVPGAGVAGLEAAEEERFEPTPTSEVSLAELERASDLYPQAPLRMVGHALQQLAELHGLTTLPKPYTSAYANWSHDPYGGGYHAWKANYDVGKVMRAMRKPLPGHDVHICGEAYSDQQAWIEGALCIAELMLQQHCGLARPGWLPADYYLGR